MKPEDIISEVELNRVHANANFGTMTKRRVVALGLLKCACGYYQGRTSGQILRDHGLVSGDYELTIKGKAYLWAAFGDGNF